MNLKDCLCGVDARAPQVPPKLPPHAPLFSLWPIPPVEGSQFAHGGIVEILCVRAWMPPYLPSFESVTTNEVRV